MTASLESLDTKNDLRLTSLENKIDNLDGAINNKITEGIREMKSMVINKVKEEIKENLRMELRNEVKEIDNQKCREKNLIVFNLPEPESVNSDDRKRDDIGMFTSICEAIGVEVDEVQPLDSVIGNQIKIDL